MDFALVMWELIDYLKEISFIVIPIVFASYLSYRVVHSWQIQKEKQEIRKKVLDEFNESYPKLRNHFDVIFKKIRLYYVDKSKLPDGKNSYQEAIIFPTDENEYPQSKFKKYFSILDERDEEFSLNIDKFQSRIILYFESFADFKQDLDIITKLINEQKITLQKILLSTSKEEFIQHCINFQKIDTQLLQKFNFIRVMIVYEKIYNTEKGLSPAFNKVTKGFEVEPEFTDK